MEKSQESTGEEARERERAFGHWLCRIEGIGRKTAARLLEAAGSAEYIYNMEEKRLAPLLGETAYRRLTAARKQQDVMKQYELLTRRGIRYLPASDPLFPRRLRHIPDSPQGIYVLGDLPKEGTATAAVIGARVCSEYGSHAARQFTRALVREGAQIISGLARGIDGISQEEAVRQGGSTFAVLGCGVDVCYPAENRILYERLRERGGILSEYPPGTPPMAGLFPQRNRIISALADLILVIEAREKSGTLITVDMALEQGKEVYAVPGRITDGLSLGCNRLIAQGAGCAFSPEAVTEALGKLTAVCGRRPDSTRSVSFQAACLAEDKAGALPFASESEGFLKQTVLNGLDYTPATPSQIRERLAAAGTALSLPELMQSLLELSMEGRCAQTAGYFYRKEQEKGCFGSAKL